MLFYSKYASHFNILSTIGHTPLVQLKKIIPDHCADIYVKLEYFNPTASYKDRMALAIIEAAEKKGTLRKGMTVVECTGGSTGTSLAFVCSAKGYAFKAISSDAFAKEKLKAIQLFGGALELIPSEGGKITPDLIPKMISRAEVLSSEKNTFWARQFTNTDAIEGYRAMGNEISQQLNKTVDVFCGAVGTAGMMAGVSSALKEINPSTKVVILEPSTAPLISKGIKGSHKVEGIGVGMLPPLLANLSYDEVMTIDENTARDMARKLVSLEGIFAGTSTGMNVVAAIEIGKKLGPGHSVITVACDSGLKYMAGGLFD